MLSRCRRTRRAGRGWDPRGQTEAVGSTVGSTGVKKAGWAEGGPAPLRFGAHSATISAHPVQRELNLSFAPEVRCFRKVAIFTCGQRLQGLVPLEASAAWGMPAGRTRQVLESVS